MPERSLSAIELEDSFFFHNNKVLERDLKMHLGNENNY